MSRACAKFSIYTLQSIFFSSLIFVQCDCLLLFFWFWFCAFVDFVFRQWLDKRWFLSLGSILVDAENKNWHAAWFAHLRLVFSMINIFCFLFFVRHVWHTMAKTTICLLHDRLEVFMFVVVALLWISLLLHIYINYLLFCCVLFFFLLHLGCISFTRDTFF